MQFSYKNLTTARPQKINHDDSGSIKGVLNSAHEYDRLVQMKGKSSSPLLKYNPQGESSLVHGKLQGSAMKLPPLSLEIKRSPMIDSKSTNQISNIEQILMSNQKGRGSPLIELPKINDQGLQLRSFPSETDKERKKSLKFDPSDARLNRIREILERIDIKPQLEQSDRKNDGPKPKLEQAESSIEKPEVKLDETEAKLNQSESKLNYSESRLDQTEYKTENSLINQSSILQGRVINYITRCACKSQVGFQQGKRKKHNQDAWVIQQRIQGVKGQYIFAVCDGHGEKGHKVSSYLKKNISENIEKALNSSPSPENNLQDHLVNGIRSLVTSLESTKINMQHSGSTLVTVLIRGKNLICANIGDSRAVIGRLTKDKWKAVELSNDHKPCRPDETERIKMAGGLVRQLRLSNGLEVGPMRVWSENKDNPGLAMSRSVGDLAAKRYGVISEPEVVSRVLSRKDKFLIMASDGIWEFISSDEAVDIVKDVWDAGKSETCCDRLIEVAEERWKAENVVDDITVLVAFINVR